MAVFTRMECKQKPIPVLEEGSTICMERRRHTRYQLRIMTVYAWRDRGKNSYREAGFTRDISIGGLFVLSSLTLPLGTTLSLEISLPPVEPGTPGLRLTFDGVVTRNVKSNVDAGFAVVGDFRQHISVIEM